MLADSGLIFLSPGDAHLAFHFPPGSLLGAGGVEGQGNLSLGFCSARRGCSVLYLWYLSQSSFEIGIMNIPVLQMRSRKIK